MLLGQILLLQGLDMVHPSVVYWMTYLGLLK